MLIKTSTSIYQRYVKYRHWLPIITFCPANRLPDLIYITLEFRNERAYYDLYKVRKTIRKLVQWKKIYMEEIPELIFEEYPEAAVTVSLAFRRHEVKSFMRK